MASGVTLDEWGAIRYTFRKGQIVRVDAAFETDKERALDAMVESRATPSKPPGARVNA